MAAFFNVEMFPAFEGDCLLIAYGETGGKTHRVLIDGGRGTQAYKALKARFAELPLEERMLDLMVNTHVDADHIEGLLRLVENTSVEVSYDDIWFNGFDHLTPPPPGTNIESFGAKQGERFTKALLERNLPWNIAFEKQSVVVPDNGDLPVKTLPGGMKITLLSPNWEGLTDLKRDWIKECKKAGIIPGIEARREEIEGLESFGLLNTAKVHELAESPYQGDGSAANASSIAFIAEYGGKSVLFAGDAHVETLLPNLARLATPATFDALKVSHHGSKGTVSRDLLAAMTCQTFLISTNGSRHEHPDAEAIARIVTSNQAPKQLICNYSSDEMIVWDQRRLRSEFKYEVILPDGQNDGTINVRL